MKITRSVLCSLALALVGPAYSTSRSAQGMLTDPTLISIPWDPPSSSVDPAYVKVAKELLGNGLSDPRAGQFCRIKVAISLLPRLYGPGVPTEALGWVQPDGQHAVLLDGLEYPINANLGQTDLDAAIGKIVSDKPTIYRPFTAAWHTDATPALLLLVGRPDLANLFVKPDRFQNQEFPAFGLCDELYKEMQYQFALSLIARKDTEGVAWASQMLKVATIRDRNGIVSRWPGNGVPMPTLEVTRDLYSDISRRVLRPKKEPIDLRDIQKLDTIKRVTLLMDNLDLVVGRQYSTDADIDYSGDPVFKAVLAEGQKAIPDLIDALEFDKRYTRSVIYWLGPSTPMISKFQAVSDVVRVLLRRIWPSSDRWKNADPIAMASALRQAWKDQTGLTESERWANVLADNRLVNDPVSYYTN